MRGRVQRWSAGPRPAATAVLVALAALLGLTAVAAPSAADAAPTSRSTPSPTPTDEDALPVRVEITQVAPAVLRPGEDLAVSARLTNTTTEELAPPRALLHLERIRPGSRVDLQRWLDEPPTGRRVGERVAQVTADAPLPPGGSLDVRLPLPAASVGLLDRPDTWGARGLSVQVVAGGERVGLQRTFALWATESEDVEQARVSLLVPAVGPGPVPQDVDVTPPGPTLTDLVAPGGRLAAVLQVARASHDVAIAVDPALLAEARDGPEATATWADAFTAVSVGRDVVALPWSDPDLTALAHADAGGLLDAAVQVSVAAAGDAIEGGRPVSARSDVLWAPGPTTDQQTLDLAAQSSASVLVLAPGDLPAEGGMAGARVTLTSSAGPVAGLVPDRTLTALLADPERLDPDATPATVVQRVLAELSVLARGSAEGVQHVLVALPRDAEPDPQLVAAVVEGIADAPWSRTAPLTALLGSTVSPTERQPLPASAPVDDALDAGAVTRLVESRAATIAFAAVTEDADTLLAGVDTAVLAPLATAWRADPSDRRTLVDAVVAAVDARRVGLTLGSTSNRNFISAQNTVRFSVRNDLPTDASVRVRTTARKGCLRPGESPLVVVPAQSEEVVPVEVLAIANCEVVVDAVLTGADGTALADPVTFEVRASPTIESVGTAIVGVLLAVGLVLGVVRTVRRGQSARRGARRVGGDAGTRPLPVLGGTPEADDA